LTRFENYKAWVKLLRPKYNKWLLFPPGPEWFWHSLANSKTHYANEDLWPRCKPIHPHKH